MPKFVVRKSAVSPPTVTCDVATYNCGESGDQSFGWPHGDRLHEGRFAAGGDDPLGRLGGGAEDFAVGPDDLGPELHLGRRGALIFHAGGDLHVGRIGRDRRAW